MPRPHARTNYRLDLVLALFGMVSLIFLSGYPSSQSASSSASGPTTSVFASRTSTSLPANPSRRMPAASAHSAAPQCSYCIFPSSKSFSSDVGVANVSVITQSGCSWTATTNDSFITIDPGSGTGSQTISYAITANSSNTSRTGTITIAGQTYTVTQDRACTPRPPNLVSWWPAEGNANDITGANNGSLQGGVSFVSGKVAKAFHFNGTDGAITINDSNSIKPANITVEAWVRFDSLDTPGASAPGLQYIVFKKNSRSSPFEGYSLYKYRPGATDHLYFTISSAAGTQIVATSTTAVTTGQFYHVAGTYDGSSVKLYVNGALENQQPASFPLDYDTRPLFFGTSGESSFDGKLKGTARRSFDLQPRAF